MSIESIQPPATIKNVSIKLEVSRTDISDYYYSVISFIHNFVLACLSLDNLDAIDNH